MYDNQIMQSAEGWWILKDDTHESRWIERDKRLDHDQIVLQKLAPYIKPGTVVYDLGAALGDHTIFYLSCVGPKGIVVAIEPHPLEFECLKRNCPTALCIPHAVGEVEDEVWLFHQPDIVAGSRLIDPETQWPMTKHRRITIDTNCVLSPPVSFMKIDIEGCEPEALRGARETIMRHRPVMWIEVNPVALERQKHSVNELRDVLENQLFYKVAEFWPDTSWDALPQDPNGPLCDILCLPT